MAHTNCEQTEQLQVLVQSDKQAWAALDRYCNDVHVLIKVHNRTGTRKLNGCRYVCYGNTVLFVEIVHVYMYVHGQDKM